MSMESALELLVKGSLVLLGVALAVLFLLPLAIGLIVFKILEWFFRFVYSIFFPLEEERTFFGGYKMSRISRFYYWLFPGKLMEKRARKAAEKKAREDRIASDLLLEYENLLKKRVELEETVKEKARAVEDFAWKIRELKGRDAYVERIERKDGKGTLESYDISDLGTYEEIKELAVELENVEFRIFAIKQELKLYGIEKEGEDEDV